MKQTSFFDLEYQSRKKSARKERFLNEMDQIPPWNMLVGLVQRHYPKPGSGHRRPVCSADIQNRLFDASSCAASPWQERGLPDALDGAIGAEKAG